MMIDFADLIDDVARLLEEQDGLDDYHARAAALLELVVGRLQQRLTDAAMNDVLPQVREIIRTKVPEEED